MRSCRCSNFRIWKIFVHFFLVFVLIMTPILSALQLIELYIVISGPMGSPRNGMGCPSGYYNDAYDLTDDHPQGPGSQHPATISGSSRLSGPHQQDGVMHNNRTPPLGGPIPPHYGDNMAYQVIKWRPFLQDTWHPVYDRNRKEL